MRVFPITLFLALLSGSAHCYTQVLHSFPSYPSISSSNPLAPKHQHNSFIAPQAEHHYAARAWVDGPRSSLPRYKAWVDKVRNTGADKVRSLCSFTWLNPGNKSPFRRFAVLIATILATCLLPKNSFVKSVLASGGSYDPATASASPFTPLQGMGLWLTLFTISATMHSAESAITKISPWKVQEFAAEEGPNSPFATMSKDMTRLLTTILIMTTACSIYSTALFVATFLRIFPSASLGFVTAFLTAITLFFGELLPKALAVSNSELVARQLVPPIKRLSGVMYPLTFTINLLSDLCLNLAGMRSVEDRTVSEEMLRRVVDEAIGSDAGIETAEGRMITSVLDMQDKEVTKIMQPRVEIVGVPLNCPASEILHTARTTRYSRIPVFRGDIDNIVGILFSKDLLKFIDTPNSLSNIAGGSGENAIENNNGEINPYGLATADANVPRLSALWNSLTASELLEKTYYIPETMSCWNALQEMRKRRIHMAVVVDEYGGTSGIITFEDLLEEVVGEIYDEDDAEDMVTDSRTIFRRADGSFMIKGNAELDDVFEALGIQKDAHAFVTGSSSSSMEAAVSTIGGLLCSLAGQIPPVGTLIPFGDFTFTVLDLEDSRRIVSLIAVKNKPPDIVSLAAGEGSGSQSGSGAQQGGGL